jgi:hypothetical protein
MNTNEHGNTVLGLLSGLLKVGLTLAGVVGGVFGLVTGSWTLVLLGVGAFTLGQVLHAIDQRTLDRQLQRWASEALGGASPIPPRAVRMHFIRSAAQIEGMRGDMKYGFQMACRAWAAEEDRAMSGRPISFQR